MSGKLAQNVRAKLFQEVERPGGQNVQGAQNEHSADVQAMLCGFILEGDDFNPAQPLNNEQDWFYKL